MSLSVQASATHQVATPSKRAAQVELVSSYGKLPLSFELNQGQTDPQVKFLSRGRGYTLFLTSNEAVVALRKPSAPGNSIFETRKSSQNTDSVGQHSFFNAAEGQRPDPALQAAIQNPDAVLRMRLVGVSPHAKVVGLDPLPGKSNYFLGNDPKNWRTNVPQYAKVKYKDIYPGIDLVYYGNQQQLEYDWVVSPGADPRAIRFEIAGAGGADVEASLPRHRVDGGVKLPLQIDSNGDFVIATDAGDVRFHKPVVYEPVAPLSSPAMGTSPLGGETPPLQQTINNRRYVDGRYVLLPHNRIGFEVGDYDRNLPLVIDPVLSYSSYLGGTDVDLGLRVAVDSSGIYLAGATSSTDFPKTSGGRPYTAGGFCGTGISFKSIPCPDAFVTKLNAAGSALVYSTYLGGSRADFPVGISVDGSGNAYVVGFTTPFVDFPTTPGVLQTVGNGGGEIFVTKLDTTGAISFSTLMGGSRDDVALASASDSSGNTYLTGITFSSDFPGTSTGFQPAPGGGTCTFHGASFPCPDAFVAKLDATGTALTYASYLGGSNYDVGLGIAVDGSGNALVTGTTTSTDFPAVSALYGYSGGTCGPPKSPHPCADAFVAKVNPGGTGLVYSTYLGGTGDDGGTAIATDASGSAHVTGLTNSTDFPTTTDAFQKSLGSGNCGSTSNPWTCPDAFLTKVAPDGTALVYSTYLGGGSYDVGFGVAVNGTGDAYITGATGSLDFPTAEAIQSSFGGGSCSFQWNGVSYPLSCPNAFLTKFKPSVSAPAYSTYLGGAGGDIAFGIAVDSSANVYLAGTTVSADFPKASPFQASLAGNSDVFVAKVSPTFSMARSSGSSTTATVTAGQTATYKLTLTPNGFVGTVSLSCSGAPKAATCTLSSKSVTLDGSTPAEVTVTVTTTARSMAWRRPQLQLPPIHGLRAPRWALLFLWLAALTILATFMAIRRAASPARVGLLSTALLVIFWAACGGGGGVTPSPSPPTGTPAGTYTLSVTATSSTFSQTSNLTLKVN